MCSLPLGRNVKYLRVMRADSISREFDIPRSPPHGPRCVGFWHVYFQLILIVYVHQCSLPLQLLASTDDVTVARAVTFSRWDGALKTWAGQTWGLGNFLTGFQPRINSCVLHEHRV